MIGWRPAAIRLLNECNEGWDDMPEALRRDYAMRVILEMEVSNALDRGEGTTCQRHDAKMVVYGSKAMRAREIQALKDMEDVR